MSLIEAIILGIIQGLTEFLPVSSSGHLELGKHLLGVELKEDLTFSIVVHGATVLSTIVVFRNDIVSILKGVFTSKAWNEEKRFALNIAISMLPVLIVGLFFKDQVEALFGGQILLVGFMLIVTAVLLTFAWRAQSGDKPVGPINSFIIGIAQAIAVLPGISRSGATISAALLLGVDKARAARFSFLMVLVPIIGANILDLKDYAPSEGGIELSVLLAGFISAFVAGYLACRWMLGIVKNGQLIWFAVYCLLAGLAAIILS